MIGLYTLIPVYQHEFGFLPPLSPVTDRKAARLTGFRPPTMPARSPRQPMIETITTRSPGTNRGTTRRPTTDSTADSTPHAGQRSARLSWARRLSLVLAACVALLIAQPAESQLEMKVPLAWLSDRCDALLSLDGEMLPIVTHIRQPERLTEPFELDSANVSATALLNSEPTLLSTPGLQVPQTLEAAVMSDNLVPTTSASRDDCVNIVLIEPSTPAVATESVIPNLSDNHPAFEAIIFAEDRSERPITIW